MALRIEDYAVIGDTETAALVGIDGSIDWMCLPRFDSGACFAALLGSPENGRFLLAPVGAERASRRAYRDGTLVLDTEWETKDGAVRVTDCMPRRVEIPDLVRVVEGTRGTVRMRMELVIRFDYGEVIPWVERNGADLTAVAGPDALALRTAVELHGEGLRTVAEFDVAEGERVSFRLTWYQSHRSPPEPSDAYAAVADTVAYWQAWTGRCAYQGEWRDAVVRSLLTLKAMTYAPTGGIVAAPTTSLPEQLGGVRNWDYRYCWLRDAAYSLWALSVGGYHDEARAWRDWLLRAVGGDAGTLQVLYGPAGERRLTEVELPWLTGYEGSVPVRIGNGAADQFQLDVYGEVLDALHVARITGVPADATAESMQRLLARFIEEHWQEPDEGLWEVRGPRRQFTHSKVMAWAGIDRVVRALEAAGEPEEDPEGDLARWRRLRAAIHADVCEHGFDAERNAFTQSYGSKDLDASLLMIPLVHFLPASDARVVGTVEAIQRELCENGFVLRYRTDAANVDGLPPGEGAFLACTFWLVDNLALMGRLDEARTMFERLLALRNDVGLLAEEWDPRVQRQVGNFPQAFTHVGLVNSAFNLDRAARKAARAHDAAQARETATS